MKIYRISFRNKLDILAQNIAREIFKQIKESSNDIWKLLIKFIKIPSNKNIPKTENNND